MKVNRKAGSCSSWHIHYGSNIYNTQIDIINKDGLAVAFFSNGYFYDTIARNQVELF